MFSSIATTNNVEKVDEAQASSDEPITIEPSIYMVEPMISFSSLSEVPKETPVEEPVEEIELPYTEEEVVILVKMVYGEARGCSAKEQAMCVWTVLNRLDDGSFGSSIKEIVTRPHQFIGYKASNPIDDDIYIVVANVLTAWINGEEAIVYSPYATGSDYLYFSGDGVHNWFRHAY